VTNCRSRPIEVSDLTQLLTPISFHTTAAFIF
jgi:hypothetical protein